MNNIFLPCRRRTLPLLAALATFTGCVTMQDEPTRQATQEREDVLLMQEQVRKIGGRMEGLELETQRLQTELTNLKAAQQHSSGAAADAQSLRTGLVDLDQRLRALEAAREKDKRELVDSLSRKIEQIMGGGPSGGGSGRKSGGRKSGGSGEADAGAGGTYVVKSGDTLSSIAAKHGVKTRALLDANGLKDVNHVRIGQKLVIPSS